MIIRKMRDFLQKFDSIRNLVCSLFSRIRLLFSLNDKLNETDTRKLYLSFHSWDWRRFARLRFYCGHVVRFDSTERKSLPIHGRWLLALKWRPSIFGISLTSETRFGEAARGHTHHDECTTTDQAIAIVTIHNTYVCIQPQILERVVKRAIVWIEIYVWLALACALICHVSFALITMCSTSASASAAPLANFPVGHKKKEKKPNICIWFRRILRPVLSVPMWVCVDLKVS